MTLPAITAGPIARAAIAAIGKLDIVIAKADKAEPLVIVRGFSMNLSASSPINLLL